MNFAISTCPCRESIVLLPYCVEFVIKLYLEIFLKYIFDISAIFAYFSLKTNPKGGKL